MISNEWKRVFTKIKEIKVNVPDEQFLLEYNAVVYSILEENQKLKEKLKASEKARKEAIKLVKTNQRKDEFVKLNEWQARDLLNILEVEG